MKPVNRWSMATTVWVSTWLVFAVTVPLQAVFAQGPTAQEEETNTGGESEFSQDPFAMGAVLDFESELKKVEQSGKKSDDYTLSGVLQQDFSYGVDKPQGGYGFDRQERGWTGVKTSLDLGLDYRLHEAMMLRLSGSAYYDAVFALEGRDEYTDAHRDALESSAELNDAYLDWKLADSTWLRVGRQVIAWGESDLMQITDIANPQDNTVFGLVDLEDARVPESAALLTYVHGDWELNLATLHEVRVNENAPNGSEFDIYAPYRSAGITVGDELSPDETVERPEYIARIYRRFHGADLALIYGDVYHNQAALEFNADNNSYSPTLSRGRVIGMSGNVALKSTLLKYEVAGKEDVPFTTYDSAGGVGRVEKQTVTGMMGLEYIGINHLRIGVEAAARRIDDYESSIVEEELSRTVMVDLQYDSLRETLITGARWIGYPDEGGEIVRLDARYKYSDPLEFRLGVIAYVAGAQGETLTPYRGNDRLYGQVRWYF